MRTFGIISLLLFFVVALAGCGSETEEAASTDEFDDPGSVGIPFRDSVRRLNQEKAWADRELDCGHFDSWESAQAFYEIQERLSKLEIEASGYSGPLVAKALIDRRRLDRNENGVACEALR